MKAIDLTSRVPPIVHKVKDNINDGNALIVDNEQPPPFTDEQMDIIAILIADVRAEWQAELARAIDGLRDQMNTQAAIGELRGQLSVLMGSEKSIEASEVIRKLKVGRD